MAFSGTIEQAILWWNLIHDYQMITMEPKIWPICKTLICIPGTTHCLKEIAKQVPESDVNYALIILCYHNQA